MGVVGLVGVDVEGVDGVVVVDPPELGDEEEPDPAPDAVLEELPLGEEPLAVVPAVAVLAFASGSGENGLRDAPWCWVEPPLVTSSTAFSVLGWLTARPGGLVAALAETAAGGVVGLEPPPNTTKAIAARSAASTRATSWQYASVEQVCLHGAQKAGHGFTLTIAAGIGELVAPVVEAGVLAPAGDVALAPAVSPWLAGSV